MKKWDKKAAQRPDIFIANSQNTQERIKKYYDRESTVVYPFYTAQSTKYKVQSTKEKYFMCLGRVVPYKRFDLAILAFNQLKLPLKIFTSTVNDEVMRLQKLS
ncbi:MAG: hypothetical protein WCK88_01030 [bacterium]